MAEKAPQTRDVMPPTWDWQLSPPYSLNEAWDVIDVDPDYVSKEDVEALKAQGVFTICYISVGTWEDWRTDAASFPQPVLGNTYADWPDERFLDIRSEALLPIMRARFERCAAKGFDAIEPDLIDTFYEETGFPLTREDMLAYINQIVTIAHEAGLKIGQKNAPDLTHDLHQTMDFAVTEDCYSDGWCEQMKPYSDAGKPILAAEYKITSAQRDAACTAARELGVSMIFKELDLGPERVGCRD